MIEKLRIQNYKALRDVALELTPVHVLIGPNDSGKTSILEAVAALCRSADHELPQAFIGAWEGPSLVWNRESRLPVSFEATIADAEGEFKYSLAVNFAATGREVTVEHEGFWAEESSREYDLTSGRGSKISSTFLSASHPAAQPPGEGRLFAERLYKALAGVQFYRWTPGHLALPCRSGFQAAFPHGAVRLWLGSLSRRYPWL